MQLVSKKFGVWATIAALGTASLFAQAPAAGRHRQGRGRLVRVMATYLNLTAAQQDQAKAIFRESAQSAKPVRQQLRETRTSLRAATKAGDSEQIQKLAATEGTELGQLSAIRANAFSKMYKILTPEQQQKMEAFHQAMRGRGRKAS